MHVGVRCQNDFENNWANTIDTYSMCSNFIDTIKRSEWVDFYFNLHGGQAAFRNGDATETCNPCGGADSVDFFLLFTHGGVNGNYAAYAMWDFSTFAWSSDLRLGDSGQQVKVFATYACDTLQTSDGHFVDRMGPAFGGGVKLLLGAHDLLYDGNSQKGTESQAACKTESRSASPGSRPSGTRTTPITPPPPATGYNADDCWNRLGMNLQSVQTSPALRDGDIGYYCWVGWNGS
jgi:hypothetical protein